VSAEGRRILDADGLAGVLDEVAVCIYVRDLDGRFLYVNRAAAEAFGADGDVSAGPWSEHDRRVAETREPLEVEEALGERIFLSHKVPLLDRGDVPIGVICVATDITVRIRDEEGLRRSERRLAEAQQIAGVGSWHWDAVHRELTWSSELCRLYGLASGAAPTDEEALLLVHEDDRARVEAASQAALAGEGPMDLDMRIVRPGGEIRLLHCRGGVTMGPDGSPHRLDGTCVDVTDRRRAERRLGEAQRLAQLGSFDWDLDADEISWSGEMYRIFGEDPEIFVPNSDNLVDRIVEADRGPLGEQVRDAVAGGGELDSFARIRRPDGRLRDVRIRGSLVPVPGAARGHLLGICQDLTDVRQAEKARVEAVERFRSVFQRAPVGMALVGPDGRFALVNEALAELLGRTPGELLELTVADVSHPDDVAESSAGVRRIATGELREWNGEMRYVRPSGEVRWGGVRALLLHDADASARHCLALVLDVTEQRLAERRRSAVREVLGIMAGGAALRDALPAMVETVMRELEWARGSLWLLDAQHGLRCEAAFPPGSMPARDLELPGAPFADEQGIVFPVVSGSETLGLLEFACEGTERLDDDLAGFAEALGAQLGGFIVRRRAEEALLHHALHDPLTGLPNRILFFDRLDHAILRQQREHAPLAVLFLDFDGFKAVNDRFGHAGGDEVLHLAAGRVAAALRAEDTVARFGGDELVVLSEHVAGRAGGAGIAERILEQLRTPIDLGGEPVSVSASIGICIAPDEGATRDELLRTADAAMYQAKAAGRDRYVIAG
jgi:diguanylate cyclase (GGDEF)-like protein/PAS domain S-box-containing protein